MIEDHYGSVARVADTLDGLIRAREKRSGNLWEPWVGTSLPRRTKGAASVQKVASILHFRQRAGDRGRTGDVQLGKLAFYR